MDIEIDRYDVTSLRTIGKLALNGVAQCYTLEDPVREPGVKVPGATAIPPGRYRVRLNLSARFKEILPLLVDVPMFEGIRIHSGNSVKDTEGCIIVGEQRGEDIVILSRVALAKLMTKLMDASRAGEEIWCSIY